MAILLRGLRGAPVKRLQEKLGLEADGIFGKGTERALKEYQKEAGLSADGVAGPDTFATMGLHDLILLKRGSKGDMVRKLQEALGIDADGKFGRGTEQAVRDYQEENELTADGLAGPKTLGALKLIGITTDSVAEAGSNAWDSVEEAAEGALDSVKKLFSL